MPPLVPATTAAAAAAERESGEQCQLIVMRRECCAFHSGRGGVHFWEESGVDGSHECLVSWVIRVERDVADCEISATNKHRHIELYQRVEVTHPKKALRTGAAHVLATADSSRPAESDGGGVSHRSLANSSLGLSRLTMNGLHPAAASSCSSLIRALFISSDMSR